MRPPGCNLAGGGEGLFSNWFPMAMGTFLNQLLSIGTTPQPVGIAVPMSPFHSPARFHLGSSARPAHR
jgi:hypothetical protein